MRDVQIRSVYPMSVATVADPSLQVKTYFLGVDGDLAADIPTSLLSPQVNGFIMQYVLVGEIPPRSGLGYSILSFTHTEAADGPDALLNTFCWDDEERFLPRNVLHGFHLKNGELISLNEHPLPLEVIGEPNSGYGAVCGWEMIIGVNEFYAWLSSGEGERPQQYLDAHFTGPLFPHGTDFSGDDSRKGFTLKVKD